MTKNANTTVNDLYSEYREAEASYLVAKTLVESLENEKTQDQKTLAVSKAKLRYATYMLSSLKEQIKRIG